MRAELEVPTQSTEGRFFAQVRAKSEWIEALSLFEYISHSLATIANRSNLPIYVPAPEANRTPRWLSTFLKSVKRFVETAKRDTFLRRAPCQTGMKQFPCIFTLITRPWVTSPSSEFMLMPVAMCGATACPLWSRFDRADNATTKKASPKRKGEWSRS